MHRKPHVDFSMIRLVIKYMIARDFVVYAHLVK